MWLAGERREGGRLPGVAQKSLAALRSIGVLDRIDESTVGLLIYPDAEAEPISDAEYA